jgi:hypothetical protein
MMIVSCKKPYNPPAISAPGSYLVVEGVINSGPDSTIIKLSRTVNLSSTITLNPVSGAVLTVESAQNAIYPLIETTNGNYVSPGLNLDNTQQYHLRIKTSDGKVFLSDFEAVNITPPIDSIGFMVQGNGIQLYVNTHDPSNNTKYYRWDYQETWQFHAEYESIYVTNGTAIVPRTYAQMIYTCFAGDKSSDIILGSSAKLTQDVIYQNPITQVTSTSEKLETKYSILVNQYALTGDAYNFWVNLKKNTEQLGSIFDAQPSNINGNIHCITNPSEPVIGYISVSTIQHKRVFIANAQLPSAWSPVYPDQCELDSDLYARKIPGDPMPVNQVAMNLIPIGSSAIPVAAIYFDSFFVIGFIASDSECVDCTIRGTQTQPSFWQ